MNPTPTNLPPSVAHNFGDRDTVDGVIEQIGFEMNQGYLSPKNGALVKAAQDRVRELASRANPAPVADEAAIERWREKAEMGGYDENDVCKVERDEIDEAVRLMRRPARDDVRLRKLRDDLYRRSVDALFSREYRQFCGNVVSMVDKLLAESPAGDAPCQTMNSSSAADADKSLPSQSPMGPQEMTHTSRSEIISGQSAPTVSTMETLRSEIRGLHVVLGKISQSLKMSGWTVPQDVVDRVRGLMAQNEQYRWMDKKLIADLNGDIDDLRARLQAAEAERDLANETLESMTKERDKLAADLAAAKADRDAFREKLDTHIEARQNCKHILVGESAVQAVERLAKERDWERHEWPKQIAAALHTEVGRIGATPSMVATAVKLEHEGHTKCFERLVKAQNDLAAAKADRSIRDAEADGRRIQDLTAQLAAAQKERDEERRKAAEHELNWRSVSDKLVDSWAERDNLQAELAAAKAESARAEVEALTIVRDNIINLRRSSYPSASPESVALKRVVVLLDAILNDDKLRAAQPQPTTAAPATVRQGDEVLRAFLDREDSCGGPTLDEQVMREVCRRLLEGKP